MRRWSLFGDPALLFFFPFLCSRALQLCIGLLDCQQPWPPSLCHCCCSCSRLSAPSLRPRSCAPLWRNPPPPTSRRSPSGSRSGSTTLRRRTAARSPSDTTTFNPTSTTPTPPSFSASAARAPAPASPTITLRSATPPIHSFRCVSSITSCCRFSFFILSRSLHFPGTGKAIRSSHSVSGAPVLRRELSFWGAHSWQPQVSVIPAGSLRSGILPQFLSGFLPLLCQTISYDPLCLPAC